MTEIKEEDKIFSAIAGTSERVNHKAGGYPIITTTVPADFTYLKSWSLSGTMDSGPRAGGSMCFRMAIHDLKEKVVYTNEAPLDGQNTNVGAKFLMNYNPGFSVQKGSLDYMSSMMAPGYKIVIYREILNDGFFLLHSACSLTFTYPVPQVIQQVKKAREETGKAKDELVKKRDEVGKARDEIGKEAKRLEEEVAKAGNEVKRLEEELIKHRALLHERQVEQNRAQALFHEKDVEHSKLHGLVQVKEAEHETLKKFRTE